MSTSALYWLMKLDDIKEFIGGFSITIAVLFGVGAALLIVVGLVDRHDGTEDEDNTLLQIGKKTLIIFIIGLFLSFAHIFIPTTKQMAALIVVPPIVNNKEVQKIPEKILNLATEWLDELKPDKKSKD